MKRLPLYIFCLLLLSGPLAAAQDTLRLVVLPFNTTAEAEPYALGLATALQRSLSVLNGVYAPPVGDAVLLSQRLAQDGMLSPQTVTAAYGARAVVSGDVVAENGTATVLLGMAGPAFPDVVTRSVSGPLADPAALVAAVTNAVIAELALPVSAGERGELDAVIAATPSLESLQAAAEGSLRLPRPDLSALESAAARDPGSSWVLSEYARALALSGQAQAAQEVAARAVQMAPQDLEAQVVRGVVAMTAGDAETALAAFDAALALNPAHPLALVGKAQLGSPAEASTLLEQAIAAYPRLVEAYVALAQLQAEASPQRALQTIRRGTQQVPESLVLHSSMIEIALASGDEAGAYSYLRDTVLARPSAAANLYSLTALLRGNYEDEALELLRQGRERYPESLMLALTEAELLVRQGDLAGAEALLNELNAATPGNAQIANELAVLQARQGRTDAARTTLEALAQTSGQTGGQTSVTAFNLAQLYLESGQAQAALTTIEPVLASAPDDAQALGVYGLALARLGRYGEARTALTRALELDPGLSAAQNALSLLEQEAALTGGEAVALSEAAASAFQRGREALERGAYRDAASAFAEARAAQDEGVVAFFHGLSLYFSGQTRAALGAFERARETYPESDVVLNNLGLAQLRLGRYDLALEHLERATGINDANANAHLNLGLANYQLGRYGAAVRAWERAVTLEPNLEAALGERLSDARSRQR